MNWTIENGRIHTINDLYQNSLPIADGAIAETASPDAKTFDARGCRVLPGIVDLHGDGFERQLLPRPKVGFPADMALLETDRQMIANGITTAYHGITVSWEPGLRGIDGARTVVAALKDLQPRFACDTRLHLRWETFALDELDEVLSWLDEAPGAIFALNDHTTSTMTGGAQKRKLPTMAARSGLSEADYEALMQSIWDRRDAVPAAIEAATARASEKGATVFAHDEASVEDRTYFRGLGIATSEFPMTEETARNARTAGEHTVLGAPNVIRGGSHNGALNAADAVRDGLCSILASDYYYPAPLHAAFKLAADGVTSFESAWDLISANAADAAGLSDRGRLAPGKRADVIVVDDSQPNAPAVVAVFAGGKKVLDMAA